MANDINQILSNRASIDSGRSISAEPRNTAIMPDADSSTVSNMADRVTLTSTANKMKNIEQRLSSSQPVDQERIQAIQTALARGEYKVDAASIADKMLSLESMM